MSNFLYLLAKSILVPTPSVQETITGSLIFDLLISNNEPKPPITSFLLCVFVFLTFFFDIPDMNFTSLLANGMLTPLFYNYFHFFFIYILINILYETLQINIYYFNCFLKTETLYLRITYLMLIILSLKKIKSQTKP